MLRTKEDLKTFEVLCAMGDGDLGTLKIEAASHEEAIKDAEAHPDVLHGIALEQEAE
ncbi:hypothetical protein [Enterococcus casseliflavus]|uniref:hypothetical protein n=1 Tax=Enterococcus casseliflavus TaxID=37734 RepID=UPI003A4C5EB0